MLKNLLRKVDAFLRNDPVRPHRGLIPFDEVLDDLNRPDPWYTSVYWFVRRNSKRVWDFPSDAWHEAKYFVQRGRRGWSDRDTWSIDWFLADPTMMPAMLRHLKAHKHGTPLSMFPTDPEFIQEDGNPTEAAHDIASRRWDETMDRMIAGFEAAHRIQDSLYEAELGEYPLRRPKGVSKEDWRKVGDDRFAASRLLEERDRKLFDEGMKLFAEHFFSLWD